MSKYLLFFILTFLSCNSLSQKNEIKKDFQITEKDENNCYEIKDDIGVIGTCSIINDNNKIFIITAAHNVIGIPTEILKIVMFGNNYDIKNYTQPNKDIDIALLFLKDTNIIKNLGYYKLYEKPKENINIHSYHFSKYDFLPENIPILSTGTIISIKSDNIYFTLNAISKGASGAPVLFDNFIVGILTNRILENNSYTGVSYGIKSETIKKIITIFNNTF